MIKRQHRFSSCRWSIISGCEAIEVCQLVTVIAEYLAIYGNENRNEDKEYGSPGSYDGERIETMEDLFLLALFEIYTKCVL